MNILVINCGSSSLKYQLIDMNDEKLLCKGLCERIGDEGSCITHQKDGQKWTETCPMPTHVEAFNKVVEKMTSGEGKAIDDVSEIGAIGHRGVHGGEAFHESVLVTDEVIAEYEKLSPLAPLHNPAGVQGLRCARKVFGDKIPNVLVFDTAFHATMPARAYMYGLPYEYYEKYGVRRYGFHGTSHRYVSLAMANYLGKKPEDVKIVTCHLGNGSSIAAVDGGKVLDTSMGMTPLGGLLMGTRSGDMDPSIPGYLMQQTGMTAAEVDAVMNKKSGLLGVSGVSSDNRDVRAAAQSGNPRAQLAVDMLAYQIRKYIGAYAAAMGGLDAIVFTGGIGENDPLTRGEVCQGLEFLGVQIDQEKNQRRGLEINDISAPGSRVTVAAICTNEELMIARDTLALAK